MGYVNQQFHWLYLYKIGTTSVNNVNSHKSELPNASCLSEAQKDKPPIKNYQPSFSRNNRSRNSFNNTSAVDNNHSAKSGMYKSSSNPSSSYSFNGAFEPRSGDSVFVKTKTEKQPRYEPSRDNVWHEPNTEQRGRASHMSGSVESTSTIPSFQKAVNAQVWQLPQYQQSFSASNKPRKQNNSSSNASCAQELNSVIPSPPAVTNTWKAGDECLAKYWEDDKVRDSL